MGHEVALIAGEALKRSRHRRLENATPPEQVKEEALPEAAPAEDPQAIEETPVEIQVQEASRALDISDNPADHLAPAPVEPVHEPPGKPEERDIFREPSPRKLVQETSAQIGAEDSPGDQFALAAAEVHERSRRRRRRSPLDDTYGERRHSKGSSEWVRHQVPQRLEGNKLNMRWLLALEESRRLYEEKSRREHRRPHQPSAEKELPATAKEKDRERSKRSERTSSTRGGKEEHVKSKHRGSGSNEGDRRESSSRHSQSTVPKPRVFLKYDPPGGGVSSNGSLPKISVSKTIVY